MPDGRKEVFETYPEAVKARQEWVEKNSLAAAKQKAEEERQAFVADCAVEEERIKQPGLLNPDLVRKKVVGPGGEYLGDPSKKGREEIIAEAARERFPEPTTGGLVNSLEGGVEKVVVWAPSLYLDEGPKELPAFHTWKFGLPIEDVMRVLNEIAAEGWYVVQVSEDRGIYSGETNQTASAVTTARYLLAKDC
jgi:hypothetical protein